MPRKPNPLKQLELAIESGDLETAKVLLQTIKSKPEAKKKIVKKSTSQKNIVKPIEVKEQETPPIPSPADPIDKFKVDISSSGKEGRSIGQQIQLGKKNTFVPNPKFGLNFAAEDKARFKKGIKKGLEISERDRGTVNVIPIDVKCDNCSRFYQAEEWEINRQIRDGAESDERMANLCNRCAFNRKN